MKRQSGDKNLSLLHFKILLSVAQSFLQAPDEA